MKLSTALLLLAFGASDAARAGTRRRTLDVSDTDVATIEPEEVQKDQNNESPSNVDAVEEERSKNGDIKSSVGFLSVSTNCPAASYWVKNAVEIDDRRKLYGTLVDAGIEGYKGNNCAPTTAGGFDAWACHPDEGKADHFTLNDVSDDSEVHIYWENGGDMCELEVRVACPPSDRSDAPEGMPYFVTHDPTQGTLYTIEDPCDPCKSDDISCASRRSR